MVFKIILFLTVLGLHNIVGKTFGKADHPKDYGIIVDFSVGSLDVQPRQKRNAFDSQLPENGRSQAESLRKYLQTIERYMPAIKENVEKIERRFSGYHPFEEHSRRIDNGPDPYENDFSEGRQDIVVETPWIYSPEHDFYSRNIQDEGDSGRINNYGEGGVNQTFVPDFAQLPRPETEWQIDNGERIESIGDLEKLRQPENSDTTSSINPKHGSPVAVSSNRDFFDVDVKEIKHHGITNLCDECGKPIQRYDYGLGSVKPLVININSDCVPHPSDRFTNRFAFQSRGHSRPLKFQPAHHHIPKYCPSFHYREMPRHHCM